MKSVLYTEYISLEEVLLQKEIFIVANDSGQFFMCFDYYAPKEAKLWYKFSIDPFDIDFLKFKRVDYGIITDDDFTNKGLEMVFRYLHTCRRDLVSKNVNFVKYIFFRGGKASNSIKKLQDKKWRKKSCTKEDYYGRIDLGRFDRIKHRITQKVKTWLEHVYQEYNYMDNSIEYIQEYYKNWVILVDIIQRQKDTMISPIWRFIRSRDIHSFKDFYYTWKKVVNGDIHVRGIGERDIQKFHDTLHMTLLEKLYWD